MEHLVLPFGAKVPVVEFPGSVDYLGVPFLEYPARHGRQVYLQAEDERIPEGHVASSIDQDETPFFATWLFCGLLQEVLTEMPKAKGQTPLFRHIDFVRSTWSDSGNRQISCFTTLMLEPLLEQWAASLDSVASDSRHLYEHIVRCLNIAHNVLFWPRVKVRPEVRNILGSTGDLVSLALRLTFRHMNFSIQNPVPPAWAVRGRLDTLMSEASHLGWCPHDISQMWHGSSPYFSTIYFRCSFARTHPNGLRTCCPSSQQPLLPIISQMHVDCSTTECRQQPIHEPERRQPHCSCELVRLDEKSWQDMLRIIDTGIPLLRCRTAGTGGGFELDVIPFQPGLEYVAISHVWSHGLGNPSANEILGCRFKYMLKAVVECWEHKGRQTNEVLMWFDTLCCPVLPLESKNRVLVTMREIYTRATYVLVLDGELVNIDTTSMTALEIGIRTLTSGWMERLWTLQEGLLPPEVWFKFRNTSFALDSLKDIDPFTVPFNTYRVAKYVRDLLLSVRRSFATEEALATQSWLLTDAAVRQRRVTVAADEPLCLSTLMNLSSGVVVGTTLTDRMQSFWKAIDASNCTIPASIVFNSGPKLTSSGFRWAPATFLNSKADPLSLVGSERAALTPNGLLVRYPGIILSRMHGSPAFRTQLDRYNPERLRNMRRLSGTNFIRDQHGSWFKALTIRSYSTGPSFSLETVSPAIQDILLSDPDSDDNDVSITETLLSRSDRRYAIVYSPTSVRVNIVQLEARLNEVQHVNIVRPIQLSRQVPSTLEPGYQIALRLAAQDVFNTGDLESMLSAIYKNAIESASGPDNRGIYTARGLSESLFHVGVAAIAQQALIGYGIVDGVSLPETQEWCYT